MWPWQKRRPDGPSVIGPGMRITGRIDSAGELTIQGRVEGDIVHDGRLIIADGAECISNIRAVSVQMAGVVHGNLQVAETLELLEGARLYGDIACTSLQVAQGAVFSGTNKMAGTPVVPTAPLPAPVQTEPAASPLAILLEPVGTAEREVLGVAVRGVKPALSAAPVVALTPSSPPPAPVLAPAPSARLEAPAFYGGFSQSVRSEAS